MDTHLGTGSDKQRANVKRSSTLVRRNKAFVQFYHFQDSFLETFRRQFSHHDALTGGLQTRSILLQTENTHFAVFTTEGFQTLEGFLTIMQASGSHVQVQHLATAYFEFAPCAVTEIDSHIVVCLHITE